MKFTAMHWVAITTLLLITVCFTSVTNFDYAWVFLLTVVGQICLVIMVFRVLKDPYTTDKTFDDFYEDRPDLGK